MATFKVGSAAGELDLGIDGSVSKAGAPMGNWRTRRDNAIEVKSQDGAVLTVPAAWAFNEKNELLLLQDEKELFNFGADGQVTPGYELSRGVLKVTPDRLNGFAFELRGEWDLSMTHDLSFTMNGKRSTLGGFISDPEGKSRFIFVFVDKKRPLLLHRLRFEGAWSANPEKEGGLLFTYSREDDTKDVFALPGTVAINRTTNQLRYEYTKNGKKSIDFEGTLVVSPDLTITYLVSRQTSGTGATVVGESTVQFGAVFAKRDFTGNLEVRLKRPDGTAADVTLTIAGCFTAVYGATSLRVGFQFDQIRNGQKVTTTFAFAGQLKYKDSTTVQWTFTKGETVDLKVGVDITLGDATGDLVMDMQTSDGKVVGVKGLLGVHW